ncbi:MAG: YdbH domain-containing protein, partial [Kiritimatiellaeota bacterium]|nr:YdbH domain-containing protein [Kiritimatiellota bacterium]
AMPPFVTEEVSNAVARVTVGVSNVWCRAGDMFAVEGLRSAIPFTWSAAGGVAFPDAPSLAWERMSLDTLDIEPTGFALANADGAVDIRTGVRCAGSALNIQVLAQVPLDDPMRLTAGFEIPDMVLEPEDALAVWMRKMDSETHVTGSLAVRADLRLLGSQPYILGQLDVADGRLTREDVDISGIRVSVPFEVGVEVRTVGRPFISFEAMKAGDARLSRGRLDFQVSPKEFFIDRLEADFCKGKIYTYSIHLDPQNPNAEVTIYADRIDLGEMLAPALPFRAERVEGVLFGRFPLAIDNGNIRLKPGYLYSLPGQGGTFRVDNSHDLEPWLAMAGVQEDVNAPLAKALGDMDFSAIRIELDTNEKDGDAVLCLGLSGQSNDKEWPVPIQLNVNVRGRLETVLNMVLKMSQKKGETQ